MKKTLVSVQIVTWKRKVLLSKLIVSLENQDLDKNLYEILICDSGSNDGTKEAVEILNYEYQNIRYFDITTNTLSAKRNFLFNKTDSPIIITLDDDLIVCNDFINSHILAHENTKNTIFCGQVRFPPQWTKISNYYNYRDNKHLRENTKGINLNDLPAKNIVVMNMSLKKQELVKIGFMNEEFVKYGGEDQEFGFRLKKNKFNISYLNNALVYHFESSQLDGYLNKLYISSRYGDKKLSSIASEIKYGSFSDFLKPIKSNDKFKIVLKKIIIKVLLNLYIVKIVKKYLMLTDHLKFCYSYNLYNYICAYFIKKGIRDQKKMEDNNTWL